MSTPLFADPISIPDRGNAPMTSTFYSRITGGVEPFDITWDFDDGSSTSKKRDTYFTFTDPGFYNVKLTVVDATAAIYETYVAVDVAGDGYGIHRPIITSPLVAAAIVGGAFVYQIVASFSPTSYGATGLPASLTLNPTTGEITGMVDAASITAVTITATNAGGVDTKVLTITAVVCSGGAVAPVFDVTDDLCIEFGDRNDIDIYLALPASPTPVFNITGLPAGYFWYPVDDKTVRIWGTALTPGAYPIVVSATNVEGADSINVMLTVAPFHLQVTDAGSVWEGEYRRCEEGIRDYSFTFSQWEMRTGSSFIGLHSRVWRKVGDPTRAIFYVQLYDMWVLGIPESYTGAYPQPGSYSDASTDKEEQPPDSSFNSVSNATYISRDTVDCTPPAPTITGDFYNLVEFTPFIRREPGFNSTNAWTFTTSALPGGLLFDTISGIFSSTGGLATGTYVITVTAHNPTGTDSDTFTFDVTGGGK